MVSALERFHCTNGRTHTPISVINFTAIKCTVLILQVPVLLGVTVNFIYDVHFNLIGTLFAVSGVLVTSMYQIVSGKV